VSFEEAMENIAKVFEAVGVAVIVIGGVYAMSFALKGFRHLTRYFADVRREFGRPLILGLEILVAADIIKTITVDPSLESVGVLGVLVAVRIALSFSLDIEIEGILPWRRAQVQHELAARRSDEESDPTPPG
jgi:uncharacterized membrane protein